MEKIKNTYSPDNYAGDSINTPELKSSSAIINKAYYDFENYVSKTRMLTFYYQILEVLSVKSDNVIEVGSGSGVVSGSLKEMGINLKTMDINPSLNPDYEGSILDLSKIIGEKSIDVILCARVLHHLSFSEFESAIKQLSICAKKCVILTLPRDELRIYMGFRRTAGRYKILSLRLPIFIKKILLKIRKTGEGRYSKLWKIDSHSETSMRNVQILLDKYFFIEKKYCVPEDQSHIFFILKPK
jgi:2-polyprenyl-3-methyl-5-hydroxy-6-metoxy-1,4-benzoquinol methylase